MSTGIPSSVLEIVTDWAKGLGLFKRNKVPVEKKVLSAFLCASGLSFREVSTLVGDISYVAVHDAYVTISNALPKPGTRNARVVGIDETQTKIGTQIAYLWLARDVETDELLTFGCSSTGAPEDGSKFIRSVLKFCASSRPRLQVGRGTNYPRALRNLDLHFQIDTTPGIRERLGRWFRGP